MEGRRLLSLAPSTGTLLLQPLRLSLRRRWLRSGDLAGITKLVDFLNELLVVRFGQGVGRVDQKACLPRFSLLEYGVNRLSASVDGGRDHCPSRVLLGRCQFILGILDVLFEAESLRGQVSDCPLHTDEFRRRTVGLDRDAHRVSWLSDNALYGTLHSVGKIVAIDQDLDRSEFVDRPIAGSNRQRHGATVDGFGRVFEEFTQTVQDVVGEIAVPDIGQQGAQLLREIVFFLFLLLSDVQVTLSDKLVEYGWCGHGESFFFFYGLNGKSRHQGGTDT